MFLYAIYVLIVKLFIKFMAEFLLMSMLFFQYQAWWFVLFNIIAMLTASAIHPLVPAHRDGGVDLSARCCRR